MLVRGAICRLASRATTHDHLQLSRLLLRSVGSRNALSLPAVCAISRAYKAAIGASHRSYATTTRATKPTTTVKKAVKKTAAKRAAPKKAAAKKPKKKTVAKAKPKKKPVKAKPKKVLTPEEKEKKLIQELKAKALKEPVTLSKVTAFNVLTSESLKGGSSTSLALGVKDLSERYQNMTPAEKEHYNHLANEQNVTREKQYNEWVRSHTPEEIRVANIARARIRKLLKDKRKGVPSYTAKIKDDRLPKRPGNPYAIFFRERHQTGDLKGIDAKESGQLIGNEWKALSASEKKKYEDLYAADKEAYEREYERTYGHKAGKYIPVKKETT